MYNFKPVLENRRRITKNTASVKTVERMIGLEPAPGGKLKRVGSIPSPIAAEDAPVVYEMDGLVAKMKVEEPTP